MAERWICPGCGAPQDEANGGETVCWLCEQRIVPRLSPVSRTLAPTRSAGPTLAAPELPLGHSFSLTSLFLLTTLIAVCLGLFVAAPGLAIALAIASVPAFVRTSLVVRRRVALGDEVSTTHKVALFAGSVLATFVIVAVTAGAAVGALCLMCVTTSSTWPITVAMVVGGVGVLIGLIVIVIRARWEHDTQVRR